LLTCAIQISTLLIFLAVTVHGFTNNGVSLAAMDLSSKYGGVIFSLANCVGTIPGIVGVYIVPYLLEL
jgi:hypothetical protein